jgi:DNA-binding MarR family transcriptional regulator
MATTPHTQERDHVDDLLEGLVDLPFERDVEAIVDRIMGLSRRVRRSLEDTLAEFELTHGEYKTLSWLRRSEGMSPGDLAANMELSSGAMTNRLDQLEKAGRVRRLPDPHDRRGILVQITEAGRDAYAAAFAAQAEKESLIAATLSASEKEQLNALLRRLMLAFDAKVDVNGC